MALAFRSVVRGGAALLVVASFGLSVLPAGCASGPSAAKVAAPEFPLTKVQVAEVIRYLYRWHMDETMLASVGGHDDVLVLARELHPKLDAGDKSLFYELLAPRLKLRIVLKKADYLVEEVGQRIHNDSFKVFSVEGYGKEPASPRSYTEFRFDRKEILDELFRSRDERIYPDEQLIARLRKAVREFLGKDAPTQAAGPQTVHVAPLSPVSNDLWIYWETGARIIRFSSDADLSDSAYWDLAAVHVESYDLKKQVLISHNEAPGSNAFVTRDWASRVLFNCVALGQRHVMTPPQ